MAILVAATPLVPPVAGRCWAFHFVNDSDEPIESLLLQQVDYEWGDMGGGSSPQARFGPVAPRTAVEIWRDDNNAAELSTSLQLLVRGASGERTITAEFGKLYRVKQLTPIAVLGRDGVLARCLE